MTVVAVVVAVVVVDQRKVEKQIAKLAPLTITKVVNVAYQI